MVATFDKHSYIKYTATGINTTLLHIVVRFYPFDMSGTILQRFNYECEQCDNVQLNLINSHLFLTVIFNGCNITLQCPSTINVSNNKKLNFYN